MRHHPRFRLLVADSFRVRGNPRTGVAEVRGWGLHLDRFARSVAAAAGVDDPAENLDFRVFLRDAAERIASYGEGFPRLELRLAEAGVHEDRGHDDGKLEGRGPELHLSLRPLPELRDTIELRTAGAVDVPAPGVKGPNISRYAELNRSLGAEALLLDADGRALEGATTSLIWWDRRSGQGYRVGGLLGGSRGALPADRVASVTERLIAAVADPPLRDARAAPAELARHEVWAVNALHGIRPVVAIDGDALPEPDPERLARFRAALERSWRPVLSEA